MNVFDEFKNYIVRHQLFKAGLELYRYESERFNQIMTLYAEHLDQLSQFKEAGIGDCPSYPTSLYVLISFQHTNLSDFVIEPWRHIVPQGVGGKPFRVLGKRAYLTHSSNR